MKLEEAAALCLRVGDLLRRGRTLDKLEIGNYLMQAALAIDDANKRLYAAESIIESLTVNSKCIDCEKTTRYTVDIREHENMEDKLAEAQAQEKTSIDISTHSNDCYKFGKRHYECALLKIKTLESALEQIASRKEKVCGINGWVEVSCNTADQDIARKALEAKG